MVVKTGPNRSVEPVEPGTGPLAGPEQPQNRGGRKPVKNRETGQNRGLDGSGKKTVFEGKNCFLRKKTVFLKGKKNIKEKWAGPRKECRQKKL